MNRFILGAVLLAVLVAFSAPTSATCPCVTIGDDYGTGTINGSIYYKSYESWPGAGGSGHRTASYTFTDVPAGVKIARVHTGIWMLGAGTANITVNGASSSAIAATGTCPDCNAINTAKMHDYCTGSGVGFITYNATDDIPIGGGDVTVEVESYSTRNDGRIYVIALLVVYENASMPSMTYWINEGARFSPTTTDFDGPYSEADVTDVTYWTLGVPHGIDDGNGNAFLNTNDINHWDYHEGGAYYDFYRWDDINPNDLNEPNDQMSHPEASEFDRLSAAVFKLWREPPELPDLVVTDIGFNPETPRPNQAFTVTATIKNLGSSAAGASTATLYVDDVSNGSAGVSALPIGDSETVSFTGVDLPEGCYDFKVVADSAGVIGESDETNNASNEDHQVGYVIIVESDSDFADLETEGLAREDGGTYYIEDLTITNCAGNGITIVNTAFPFVIDNCTITNCKNSGVFVNNANDGTITECTLQNNEVYGVEIGVVPLDSTDPERINITCNTIYQNDVNGIDLIGFDCIVRDNTIRDSAAYGIYVCGNDSKICNNIIEDNDNYGVKLYNSSGNYVYWNNFTNNNGVGVQGHDEWLGLPELALNTWNSPKCGGYPYGTVYTNYTGNYWDDHTAPDTDGDGIVNTAYPIDGGAGALDSYPLVTLPWRFNIPIYNGKNLIAIPLIQDDPTLAAVFGDNPVNWDKVRRYIPDPVREFRTAYYYNGVWYGQVLEVEPVEPEVGYEYERQSVEYNLEVLGARVRCSGVISTPIYNGKNLIGYVNFTDTDLSTFNSPVNWDKVRRYIPDPVREFRTAYYYNGVWYGQVLEVEPVEVGVGYEYAREGAQYNWTYDS